MSKTLEARVLELYYTEGWYVWQIADEFDISEWDVVRIIKPKGY